MKIFYVLLFSFVAQLSFAQCDDTQFFTEVEKENFVKTYLAVKSEKPQSQDKQWDDLATKYSITPQSFRDIQHRKNNKQSLTDNQKHFIVELEELKSKYKLDLKAIEVSKCEEVQLNYELYLKIQHQYRSCMKFQRSLSSHFNKWIK